MKRETIARPSQYKINPLTAPACQISGLKDARTRLQTVYFPVLYHIYFQCYAFWGNPFRSLCKRKKAKRLKGFKFGTFIGRFQVTSWQCEGVNISLQNLIL